jgi:hypothetical protein
MINKKVISGLYDINHQVFIKTLLYIDEIEIMKVQYNTYGPDLLLKRKYKLDDFLFSACFNYLQYKKDFHEILSIIYIILGHNPQLLLLKEEKEFGQSLSNKLLSEILKSTPDVVEKCLALIKIFKLNTNRNIALQIIDQTKQTEKFDQEFVSSSDPKTNVTVNNIFPNKIESLSIRLGCIQ